MQFPKTDNLSNPIYTEFFSRSKLDVKVDNTIWRGVPSNNSFCFINPKVKYKQRENEVLNKLKEVFEIKSDSFDKKYCMAISGDGQEVKRISTLHSSSLAALLLLYSVSERKPLKCILDNNIYTFNESFFEVKTEVKDSHFSNMDVVLVGKNSEDKDVIYFLESKFSEYLHTGMCNNISLEAYKDKYDGLGLINNDDAIKGLHFIKVEKGKDDVDCLQITSDTPQYCSGIKQMISHFIGVTNFAENGEKAMDPKQKKFPFFDELLKLQKAGAEIILGEVLFGFDCAVDGEDSKGETKLSKYSSIYEQLAEILKANTSKVSSKVHVLPQVLTYQELLEGFELDDRVKAFYQL